MDLSPGDYEVCLAKPGFGCKRVRIAIGEGKPYYFRLLSDRLLGYAWPKWCRAEKPSNGASTRSSRTSWDCGAMVIARSLSAILAGTILWIIEHAPEVTTLRDPYFYLDPTSDGEVYQLAKNLWLKLVEANESNVTILGNASGFFTLHDKALSEELLKKAQSLEPNNPEWAERLGHLYELEMDGRKGESRPAAAILAFVELEKAFNLENDELKRFWMMPNLAKIAFRGR
jgi:hypothetical protein